MLFFLDNDDRTHLTEVPATTLAEIGWQELDLENLIADNIDRLVRGDDLLVIGQERNFQEEPDIMALDREGCLHLFELKRWQSSPENLLQVLRYGQRFGQYDYSALNHVFTRYQRKVGGGGSDLDTAHAAYFELSEPLRRTAFNGEQRFVVITDGLDQSTRDAIEYWGNRGIPVSALPYRVYQTDQGPVIELRRYGAQGQDFDEVRDGLVLVNTNSTYMPDAWREMIEGGKVAAYYGRKRAVEGISRGALVALYHTGVGIIAIGRAEDGYRRTDVGEDDDEEFYVPCEFELTVDPGREPHLAVTAREINNELGSSHRFRQTVYTLPAAVYDFARRRLREKRDEAAAGRD